MRLAPLVAALLLAAPLAALEVPPVPRTYLSDFAGALADAERSTLENRLAAFESRTGHQFIAVLFRSLEGDSLEDFTIRCAETWKVGRKGLDDGLIFFAFLSERRMRLEVGYGLEATIPDALAARLLDRVVKPAFRQGDIGGGVSSLTDALEKVFAGEDPIGRKDEERAHFPTGILILIILLVVLQSVNGRGRGQRRGRGGFWGLPGGFGGGGFGGGGFGGGGFFGGGGGFGGGGASGSW